MNQAKIKRHLDKLALLDEDLDRGLELVKYPKPRIREQGFETLLSAIVSTHAVKPVPASCFKTLRRCSPKRAWLIR